MLNYNDYQMIRDLRENNKEVYDLIRRIIDYSLASASHACHDLKNHTALISGYCQLLSMTEPEISQNPYIQKIELSVNNQLAQFDEIAAFRYSFNNGELTDNNLVELLKKSIEQTNSAISLHIDGESSNVNLVCNPSHLTQAFCAILTNAVEACEPDNIKINVSVYTRNNYAEIVITDNGTGFTDEMLASACEPFKTDKKKHSGLGLAIAATVIYKHKGDLQIANTTCGSQITITFPL